MERLDSERTGARALEAILARMDGIVDWERRDRSAGMVRSLEPVRDLLRQLGDPQARFRAVHVGGSKGKGSVCALIDAGLRAAGIAVGVYASPHVERVTERVRVGGEEVGEGELAAALEQAWEARARAQEAGAPAGAATWFDLMTAAAFLVFAARGVEWAVVEVGLGGRLDSTNVVEGEVAVLVNVELEHTAVLGDTKAAIAVEKAAILKAGRVLVTGVPPDAPNPADDAAAVVRARAREVGGRARFVDVGPGPFARRNRRLAEAALEELGRLGVAGPDGRRVGPGSLTDVLAAGAALPARDERFDAGGVPVVLDAAHVARSMTELLDELGRDPALVGLPKAVLALGKDKQVEAVLKALVGRVDRVLCTSSATGPLLAAEELARRAREQGLAAEAHPEPADALERALAAARERGGWVLVSGSFYTAGVLRPRLRSIQGRSE